MKYIKFRFDVLCLSVVKYGIKKTWNRHIIINRLHLLMLDLEDHELKTIYMYLREIK